MKKSTWKNEFRPRNLEEIERREMLVSRGSLSDESVSKCLAADAGWKESSRFDVWATRAMIACISYLDWALDWAAVFLIGFVLGYVPSALRY